MRRLERQARLVAGVVLALYVVHHLGALGLGLVSFQWMENARSVQQLVWHSIPGTCALYGALFTHFVLGLHSLARRRTLRMPRWEAIQLALGLLVPLLLIDHVVGTRLTQLLLDIDTGYMYVVSVLWNDDWYRIKQLLLIAAVWVHTAMGLHFWLRLRVGYARYVSVFYALAVAVPVIAVAGFVRAGVDSARLLKDPAFHEAAFSQWNQASAADRQLIVDLQQWLLWFVLSLLTTVIVARWLVSARQARRDRFILHHPAAGALAGVRGQSVLEVLRSHRVPHASVCGGRARCTTCRIRIAPGHAELPLPRDAERAALERIRAPDHLRLACQLRPRGELRIDPVLPPDASMRQRGGVAGREQKVVAMFVDLRGSTALGEHKMPFDVVFVLNRFFAEMSAALDATGGHYAQFAGDGLLALYGLEGELSSACRDALRGAQLMQQRVAALSDHLADEITAPLRIGIGVHAGEAIVGTMGPPASPNLSAVGDNINVAARLESLSKEFRCVAVVSATVLELACVDTSGLARHEVSLRGRDQPMAVCAIEDLDALIVPQ